MPIFKAVKKKSGVKPRRPLLTLLPVLGLFALLGMILWYSYPQGAEDNVQEAVPIIRADATPYKVIPSEPGGMEIPYRDSTVFETLRAARLEDGEGPKVESLLPQKSEAPVDRAALFAGLKTDVEQADVEETGADVAATETSIEDDSVVDTVETVMVEKEVVPVKDTDVKESVQDADITTPLPTEKVETAAVKVTTESADDANHAAKTEPAAGDATTAIETTTAYKTDPQGGYYVQLGSFRSADDVKKGWTGTQDKFPSLLSALDLHIERADLGERGIFYRMQAGPLGKSAANEICTKIKQAPSGGCFVVSR